MLIGRIWVLGMVRRTITVEVDTRTILPPPESLINLVGTEDALKCGNLWRELYTFVGVIVAVKQAN